MTELHTTPQMVYNSFEQAKLQLQGLTEIDYFFAKEMQSALCDGMSNEHLSAHQTEQLFHLFAALSESLRQGHSCLPINIIAGKHWGRKTAQDVISHQGFSFDAIDSLHSTLALLTLLPEQQNLLVYANSNLYLRRYFLFEQTVIEFFQQANQVQALVKGETDKFNQCISTLFPKGISDSAQSDEIDWQKIAVANALNKRFSIIAGGPGTGKTYTVTKLLAALVMLSNNQALNIALVAPTGKAAQRLSESINQAVQGFESLLPKAVLSAIPTAAQTIHRLLGVIPNSPNFKHDQNNKLAIDILLIDEVSMVDLPLMARIFRALPQTCKVILLGDAQQLPSVAAGSILADFTQQATSAYSAENKKLLQKITNTKSLPLSKKSPMDHLTYLIHSRRFSGDGGIGKLAKLVIDGECQNSWQLLQNARGIEQDQLSFLAFEQLQQLMTLALNYYRKLARAESISAAFEQLSKFRILTATRQGSVGVEQLNQQIESQLMSENPQANFSSSLLYQGKPIMIGQNDYSLGLYNGDIGIIWPNEQGHLIAYFEAENGEYRHFIPSRLPSYQTVYAMTIHKTQGSEFSHVALILPENSDNQLLTRELLYTGITRAKNALTVCAKQHVWSQGVDAKVHRYSGITPRVLSSKVIIN